MDKNKVYKIFIDGSAGTTGLRIRDRLSTRSDIDLLVLEEAYRKDAAARKEAIETSDITFLCLPDSASEETMQMITDSDTVIIDTSTAHRTAPGWTYGFPELKGGAQKEMIHNSRRISNPGCHASGFIALIAPLTEAGLLSSDAKLSCFSLTGYSGGGKSMIAEYQDSDNVDELRAPRLYALSQEHKHLPEMQLMTGLDFRPTFSPIVAPYYSGMEVTVPVHGSDINGSMEDIKQFFTSYYDNGLIRYSNNIDEGGFISASKMSGRDDMLISVYGGEDRIILSAVFDNLGKGASGAAIQNMNLVMGVDEMTGLVAFKEDI